MRCASVVTALLGFAVAAVAAWYWYRLSKVEPIPTWARGKAPFEPVVHEMSQDGWIGALLEASKEAAHLNKWGAILTGISILLAAASAVLGTFANSN